MGTGFGRWARAALASVLVAATAVVGVSAAAADDPVDDVSIPSDYFERIAWGELLQNELDLYYTVDEETAPLEATKVGFSLLDCTWEGGRVQDFQFSVTSPAGTEVVVYEGSFDYSRLIGLGSVLLFFADDAAEPLPADPRTGFFLPDSALAAFDGEDPNGEWTFSLSTDASHRTHCVLAAWLGFDRVFTEGTEGTVLCDKVGTDVRVPYADGSCPSGFDAVEAATGDRGIDVCSKVKTDLRAPYKDGSCPSGFDAVTLAEGPGTPSCIKVKTDVRSPYRSGLCPSGFDAVSFAAPEAGNPPRVEVEPNDEKPEDMGRHSQVFAAMSSPGDVDSFELFTEEPTLLHIACEESGPTAPTYVRTTLGGDEVESDCPRLVLVDGDFTFSVQWPDAAPDGSEVEIRFNASYLGNSPT